MSTPIGMIVARDYRVADFFEKYRIDFFCEGDRILGDVIQEKNIDMKAASAEIASAMQGESAAATSFNAWPLDVLADYIVKTHHRYCETQTAALKPLLLKSSQVQGRAHPELPAVKEIFDAVAGEMTMHMKKEELMLFPFIRRMVRAEKEKSPVKSSPGGNRVEAFIHEHDDQKRAFEKIRELTNEYRTPADATDAYKSAVDGLSAFEQDLHKHLHLENNILFPKAIELEKRLIA